MLREIKITVNGAPVAVPEGATIAVAMAISGEPCRKSVSGQSRATFCGMGICYECRVTLNGKHHCRSCQILCEAGMDVRTDD